MDKRPSHSSRMPNEPIAIIGSACRFPGGSSSPSKLWELLRDPKDVLNNIPRDRFSAEGFYHVDGQYHGHSNVQQSYFLTENVREFDAPFFGVKPVEANATDPQQRLLLETVYEGIESAGLTVDGLRGSKTAVYVGLMCADYDTLLSRDTDSIPTYHATGTARSIMSNRVSYFFDWRGPSMTIDTACSSSLIAVHEAVQVLRHGDSRVAVAAGSNLILGPEQYIAESKLKMLSPDSRSRMWDADANGYARGEGVAAVVLKTLSAALADGDHIECLIRETGINQDGKTKGITMPSATAQAALIRDTYLKAGLDLSRPEDRCQYFEAHGTGTPAGDPIEAEAISSAFFPSHDTTQTQTTSCQDILYVGSIKTVVGHTEGTAGLAAVMKASLALQNRTIPPNLLFNKLNPAIEPYYNNLRVPSRAIDWPPNGPSQVRRASVNSFGFGGANAHAILESYDPSDSYHNIPRPDSGIRSFLPFNFSANSERSLISLLNSYSSFLKSHSSTPLRDLAFTLYSRRSEWPVRASFSATTVEELCGKIDEYLSASAKQSISVGIRSKPMRNAPRILGVFTGQGAQWARMGRELLLTSEFARSCIFRLDRVLAELPADDRPSWSIQNELIKDPEMSRINEAELSQPLCTALQILLVDILHRTGVKFTAVVGHSSGEIGAAYAASLISARDAICIAYYRGIYAKHAQGATGQRGSMLVAGTSLEDAQELCELPYFQGRMTVAASNSSASVTLSGDQDQIKQAELVFKDEKKFVRLLKVDKAYHSHHMTPCAEPYLDALRRSEVQANIESASSTQCQWFSSVTTERIKRQDPSLKDGYWVANMMKPVLLKEALTRACSDAGPFDIALEIGPHPALKSPASQTIQEVSDEPPLYLGLLQRGQNDVEAVADCLGTLWAHFPDTINLALYDKLMSGLSDFKLLKGLPSYSWDHDREYWHESRESRVFRLRESVHELLGHLSHDSSEEYYGWRNVLRMSEIPWLQGHKLQGQTVFPAAGYIVLALEAALKIAGSKTVRSLEVTDVTIGQALTFNEDDSGIETIFTISNISHTGETSFRGNFTYHGVLGKAKGDMTLLATGMIEATLGDPDDPILPLRSPPEPNLIDVDVDQFYTSLLNLGYGYSGPFRALSSMRRMLGWSTGLVSTPEDESDTKGNLIIHPGMLDATIQSVLLAYCFPNDGRLWSLHVPTAIRRVTLDLSLLPPPSSEALLFPFDATLSGDDEMALSGDVDVYCGAGGHAMLQIEGITCVPFSTATARDDRKLFSHETWSTATPDAVLAAGSHHASTEDYALAEAMERTSYYYVRQLQKKIPLDHPARSSGPYVGLFRFVDDILTNAPDERHPFIKTEWKRDTKADIEPLISRYGHTLDLQIVVVVGEQIPRVIFEETTILEHLMKDDLLYNYYSKALGFSEYTGFLAATVAQITNRYPHMNVLEIGAGTGATTRHVVDRVGTMFASYAFTDISNGFFETAKVQFKEQANKMVYKTLDIEGDPAKQGFVDRSFDIIIASNVLHATKKLEHTLKNVRRLLKPGGYLVMMEITDNGPIRSGFVFGSLPGWWLGADDGRVLSPVISPEQWDVLLRKTGFSGVDTVTPDTGRLPHPGSVFVSQAIDDKINFLRNPLSIDYKSLGVENLGDRLIILGGKTPETKKLADGLEQIMAPIFNEIKRVETVAQISALQAQPATAILSITELDAPLFRDLTTEAFEGFRAMFEHVDTILWITKGCKSDEPYANMTIGYGRSQMLETPDLSLQFLDLGSATYLSAEIIAEAFERFCASRKWSRDMSKDYLWSIEPELVLDQNKYLISRLVANQRQNDRFNAARRPVYEEVSPQSAISIQGEGDSLIISQDAPELCNIDGPEYYLGQIRSSFSTLSAITLGSLGSLFVILGIHADSNEQILCFSESNSSIIQPRREWSMPCQVPAGREAQYVSCVASNIVAASLLHRVPANGSLVVHDPPTLLAEILIRQSTEKAVEVTFTASSSTVPESWIFVHPRTPSRKIKTLLPAQTALFADFSRDVNSKRGAEAITKVLPVHCQHETADTIYVASAHILNSGPTSLEIQRFLREANENSARDIIEIDDRHGADILPIAEVAGINKFSSSTSVVQWDREGKVRVRVSPVDAAPMFKSNKTYWLVGLTQSLGLSLCEWMVRHGARYVVLSSRNPKIDPAWLAKMTTLGATIKCAANDVTNRDQVDALYHEICDTLPPIAGVGQGAMVLRDALSRDMDLENLQTVTGPKVKGSIHLDRIFSDKSLDFFVFFSSMATIVGNLGQCNYTAANAFMASLSDSRRKRGLASSVINIGAVLGAGYVTQQLGPVLQEKLVEGGHTWMSESAFHQVFAEGVRASDPSSKEPSQISTGLRFITAHDPEKPFWSENPKFAHQTITEDAADVVTETDVRSNVPLRTQILAATDREQVFDIIKDQFLAKLESVLQLSSDSSSSTSILDQYMDQLGVDSLIAVDLRTWFMKSLGVNMPVLKILGGASIRELLDFTMDNLPPDLKEKAGEALPSPEAALDISLLKSSIPDSKTSSTMAGIVTPDHESTDTSQSRDKSDDSSEITDYLSAAGELSVNGDEAELRCSSESLTPSRTVQKREALSYSQSMFWFVTAYLDDATTLNHTGAYHLQGAIREDDLARAVETVAKNHEILRTCFFSDEQNDPVQGIMESSMLHLETKTVYDKAGALKEVELMKKHVFNLEQGRTMRLVLLSQSPLEHYLIIGCHHIVTDGTSHQVFMADLEKAYTGQLPSTVLQYSAFGIRQREKYQKRQAIPELKYWREEFSIIPPPLPSLLARDIPREPLQTYSVRRVDFRVEKSLSNRVRQACRQAQATPFHFYLTIFRILLTQLTGVDTLCIGMAEANRKDERMMEESALGPYVNLLPLYFQSEKQQSFLNLLSETRRKVYSALANSDVPFEVLLDELRVPRSTTHSPLFQSFIDYRQGAKEKLSFSNCELEVLDFEAGRTGYDISLDIIDNPGDDCLLMLMTQGSLYSQEETEFFMSSYIHLLTTLAENVSAPPDIFRQGDKEKALALGRGSFCESHWPATLVHRIEDMTAAYGNEPAVRDGNGNTFTYAQLSARAQSIASSLLSAGIKSGDAVAVYQEPSSDFIGSLLGILWVGAVYVPFDYSAPLTRLADMAADASIEAIIVHQNTAQDGLKLKAKSQTDAKIIDVSAISANDAVVPISANPEATAAILYTSGSTGKPKGILLKHSNLSNEIEFSGATYSIKREAVLQQSSFGFDMSFTQVFGALAFGGVLHIAPRSIRGDAIALYNMIVNEKITFTAGTPSEYVSWLRNDESGLLQESSWRTAISGGEHISLVLLQQLQSLNKPDLQIFNCYGPTEITCSAARSKLSIDQNAPGPISAGLPAPNCSIYILNESLEPVISGLNGEIFVGGAGVASGYLDHEITQRSFLSDPFAPAEFHKNGWDTMYRTGDIGRWLKDGTLLIEGRIAGDTQVKLRGLRIDLQDLEHAIVKTGSGAIAEVVASVRSAGTGQPEFLVAHVVLSAGLSADAIEKTLSQVKSRLPLPQYMHPALVIPMAGIPRNSSGKLDRRSISALLVPLNESGESVSRSLTKAETDILGIWKAVLPPGASIGTTIDSQTDFFDIGGNSLLLLNIQARLRQSFGVTLPLVKLFDAPTIRGMSASIRNASSSGQGENIDWEAETAIPADFYEVEPLASMPYSKTKIVVLTGASGFLGRGLLQGLLADDTVTKVHCVAVRDPSSLDDFAGPRIVVHSGDLTLPNVGLSATAAHVIFSEATVVIHNGADVSHLKAFQTLKRTNLESTKELVKLCLPRRIPFHYISTAGVALRSGMGEFGEVSVTPYVTPTSDSDGYTASKWCSERFLEKTSQQFQLQSWIHRPTSIIREGDPGLDLLQNLLKYVKQIMEVPQSAKLQGFFDMVYLDTVVNRVVRSLHHSAEGSVSYVNHSGDVLVPFSDLVGYLEKENGGKFTTCTMDEWVAKAEAAGMSQLVAEVFKHVEEGSPVTYPRFSKRAL